MSYCTHIQNKGFKKNKSAISIKFSKQKISQNRPFSNFSSVDSCHNFITTKISSIEFSKYLKQIFLALIGKSEHKGVRSVDMECILISSSLKFLSRLNFTINSISSCWLLSRILISINNNCGLLKFVTQRYRLQPNYFKKISRLKAPPCLSCPTKYECEPQGNINPFECAYLKKWENGFKIIE